MVKAFQDKKRNPSGAFQLTSFAAVQALLESIKAVGDNPAKVADHLHKANFDTVLGTVGWNKQGDLKAFDFQVFQWHKDGSKTPAAK
ncbi:Leu/Ile/Val/Thr-binding protein precursor [compost metagenome]